MGIDKEGFCSVILAGTGRSGERELSRAVFLMEMGQ